MEIFDITDDNGVPTGKTISRNEAHEKGIPHKTAHMKYLDLQRMGR